MGTNYRSVYANGIEIQQLYCIGPNYDVTMNDYDVTQADDPADDASKNLTRREADLLLFVKGVNIV